jgi:hypothetical protein
VRKEDRLGCLPEGRLKVGDGLVKPLNGLLHSSLEFVGARVRRAPVLVVECALTSVRSWANFRLATSTKMRARFSFSSPDRSSCVCGGACVAVVRELRKTWRSVRGLGQPSNKNGRRWRTGNRSKALWKTTIASSLERTLVSP